MRDDAVYHRVRRVTSGSMTWFIARVTLLRRQLEQRPERIAIFVAANAHAVVVRSTFDDEQALWRTRGIVERLAPCTTCLQGSIPDQP